MGFKIKRRHIETRIVKSNEKEEVEAKEDANYAILFESDEAFLDFCINPDPVFHESSVRRANGEAILYYDFDFSGAYKQLVQNEKMHFYIAQKTSKIVRRQCVSYRTASKLVKRVTDCLTTSEIDVLIVPEGVRELSDNVFIKEMDFAYLQKLYLPSTLVMIKSELLEELKLMQEFMWKDGIVIPVGTMEHFKRLLPESTHHLLKEDEPMYLDNIRI